MRERYHASYVISKVLQQSVYFKDLDFELHMTNKGYDELQLAYFPAYPQH